MGLTVWGFIYCPATVDCHDIKARNAGNQLSLLGNQLYTKEKSELQNFDLQKNGKNTPDKYII